MPPLLVPMINPSRGVKPIEVSTTLAIFDGGDGTAVAQMAGDDFGSFNRTVQLAVSAADKTVAGSVEAVTTDGVFLVIFIRNAEHVGLRRHGLMERSVEDRDHGSFFAEYFLAGFHCGSLRRVVQRANSEKEKYLR